jgi:hypothetical protein
VETANCPCQLSELRGVPIARLRTLRGQTVFSQRRFGALAGACADINRIVDCAAKSIEGEAGPAFFSGQQGTGEKEGPRVSPRHASAHLFIY